MQSRRFCSLCTRMEETNLRVISSLNSFLLNKLVFRNITGAQLIYELRAYLFLERKMPEYAEVFDIFWQW